MKATGVKKLVRERDGHRCTKCGMTGQRSVEKYGRILDVHRIEPGSKYTVDGCETICRSCHTKEPGSSSFRFMHGEWRWFLAGDGCYFTCKQSDPQHIKDECEAPQEWPPIPHDKVLKRIKQLARRREKLAKELAYVESEISRLSQNATNQRTDP